jgi:hypothetical protein
MKTGSILENMRIIIFAALIGFVVAISAILSWVLMPCLRKKIELILLK